MTHADDNSPLTPAANHKEQGQRRLSEINSGYGYSHCHNCRYKGYNSHVRRNYPTVKNLGWCDNVAAHMSHYYDNALASGDFENLSLCHSHNIAQKQAQIARSKQKLTLIDVSCDTSLFETSKNLHTHNQESSHFFIVKDELTKPREYATLSVELQNSIESNSGNRARKYSGFFAPIIHPEGRCVCPELRLKDNAALIVSVASMMSFEPLGACATSKWLTPQFQPNSGATAMNNLIPFTFNESSVNVILDDAGTPWFVAKDVAAVLGYKDTEAMTRRLDEDEKSNLQIVGLGTQTGGRGVTVISESGLWACVLGSKKAEARPFRKWVTSEVLPAIRKTGSYTSGAAVSANIAQPQTLSPQQKHALQEIVKHRAAQFPKGLQKGVYSRLWGALKQVFAVASYNDILAKDFDMACMILRNANLDVIVPELSSNPLQLESSTPPQPTMPQISLLLHNFHAIIVCWRGAGDIENHVYWGCMAHMLHAALPYLHKPDEAYEIACAAAKERFFIKKEPVRTALPRARKQQLLAA